MQWAFLDEVDSTEDAQELLQRFYGWDIFISQWRINDSHVELGNGCLWEGLTIHGMDLHILFGMEWRIIGGSIVLKAW